MLISEHEGPYAVHVFDVNLSPESPSFSSVDYTSLYVLSWISGYIHYDELDYSNRFV